MKVLEMNAMCFLTHRPLMWVVLHIQLCHIITAVSVIGLGATVKAGDEATLFCQLVETNERLTRITWQKRTRETLTNKNFFIINSDGKTENINGLGVRTEFIGNIQETTGTILLKNVTLLDEGVYTCIFNIFPSGPFETEIHLSVLVSPVVGVTTDVIPVVGESEVTLATCTAAIARPAAVVSWSLGALSNSVKVQTNISADPDGSFTVQSFLIGEASKDLNQQKVQCLVNHTSLNEELILDYTLIIHYPPQVVSIIPVNVPTTSKEFQCIVDANPQPTFTWSRENKVLSSPVNADRLIIPLTSDSNGLYICNVSNQYGNGIGTLYVNVSRECTAVCWSLFIILLGVTAVFLIWRFNLTESLMKCPSQLRDRIWRPGHDPVSTGGSTSPSSNRSQNRTDRSKSQ
ncbi:nectin-1-like isoform X2 [Colossoma macropomum]|uniref:nectin-1-like isoform X2 n=1 Tax=Colossoma macropomum TaxID=42526 RepID=UPI0018642713|nr:nectin-1-like isoform X2 [Colossoma macropomum]